MMFKIINWRVYLYGIAAAAALSIGAYWFGHYKGVEACQVEHDADTTKQVNTQLQADLVEVTAQTKRATDAGATLAATEQNIRTRTQTLTKEVIKYVPITNITNDGYCGPDPELVRTWNAANSGSDAAPAAAAERDAGVP